MKGWRGQDTGEKGGRDRAGAKEAGTEPEIGGLAKKLPLLSFASGGQVPTTYASAFLLSVPMT